MVVLGVGDERSRGASRGYCVAHNELLGIGIVVAILASDDQGVVRKGLSVTCVPVGRLPGPRVTASRVLGQERLLRRREGGVVGSFYLATPVAPFIRHAFPVVDEFRSESGPVPLICIPPVLCPGLHERDQSRCSCLSRSLYYCTYVRT